MREITEADQQLVAFIPRASAASGLVQRLASSKGVMVLDAGGPAGYAWCTGAARENEGTSHFHFPVVPAPGTGYIFDVVVAPAKQGGGYGRLLLSSLLAQAERDGLRSVFLFTGIRNHRMRRLCASLGFVEVGELRYRRVLGRVWSDISALKKVGGAGGAPEGGAPGGTLHYTVDSPDLVLRKARLDGLIRDKLGLDPARVDVVEIFGGTNQCFSVSGAGAHYFIRLPGTRTSVLGIRRDVELAALKAVASIGVCAEPVFFSESDGTMITARLEGRQLSRGTFSSRSTIRAVVQAVKRVHGISTVSYMFSPFSQIRDRVANARQRNVPLPGYFNDLMAKLDEIEKRYADNPRKCVGFCHNDLITENFIFSESVRILDWEFAGMGDIFYDLATLGLYFPDRKRRFMLKCYFGAYSRRDEARLNDMLFVARLWNAMWAAVLDDGTEQGIPYRRLASAFFESIREKSFMERCLQKSQVPRVYRKAGRILARLVR